MKEPEDCEHCRQSFYLHHEIKDNSNQTFYLCPTSVYTAMNVTKYMTRKERKAYEDGHNSDTKD